MYGIGLVKPVHFRAPGGYVTTKSLPGQNCMNRARPVQTAHHKGSSVRLNRGLSTPCPPWLVECFVFTVEFSVFGVWCLVFSTWCYSVLGVGVLFPVSRLQGSSARLQRSSLTPWLLRLVSCFVISVQFSGFITLVGDM
jgi:hypothetical protein